MCVALRKEMEKGVQGARAEARKDLVRESERLRRANTKDKVAQTVIRSGLAGPACWRSD